MDVEEKGADAMSGQTLDREIIIAMLRMRFGTLGKFETARGLPKRSVTDVLRGRSVRQTEKAIAEELGVELHVISPRYADFASTNADNNSAADSVHRLIAAAR